jgi:sporulation protein YlmC with PRC-barrel domain
MVFGCRVEEFVTKDSDVTYSEFFGLELGAMGAFDSVFDSGGAHLGKVTNVTVFVESVRITLVNVTLHI